MMGRKFTKEEDEFLQKNYLTIPAKTMSRMLGRTEGVARQRMQRLGIIVPKETTERFRLEGFFKKGSIPVNKGKKLEDYLSQDTIEKIKKTQFQKGIVPANLKPIGYERISKDGYIEVKTETGFRLKHRLIWEEHYGPIPKGMNVQFANRNKMDIRIENLELVSRVKNMQRNSIHNYGPEIANAYQLIGAINRQINQQLS